MAVDPHVVIASARRRGLSDAVIARQLGLRDGQTGYGLTRQDWDRPAVVVAPAPTPQRPDGPLRIRGLNTKYSNPDLALAEMIKAAGELRADIEKLGSRERRLNWQSTAFLICNRAHLSAADVARIFGLPGRDHVLALIRAARDRITKRYGPVAVRSETARQQRIMEIVGEQKVTGK